MSGIAIDLLGRALKTTLVGAITNKVVDTVITSKLNKKKEHSKWRREVKLQLFSNLSNEILSFDLNSCDAKKEKELKELCTKTILLLDDKKLIYKIEQYLTELNATQRALIFDENNTNLIVDFNKKSMDLVIELNTNLKQG